MSDALDRSQKFRVAVTMETESWILRQIAQHFRRLASENIEVQPVELGQPLPPDAEAVLYVHWPHLYASPPRDRNIQGALMVGHMDRSAFRLRYLLWRYPRLQVICMASRWKKTLRGYFIPEERLHLLPHGIDLELFHPAALAPTSKRIRIGFVGRAYPGRRKGEDRLLEISRRISPERFEFVLVGDRWEAVEADLESLGFTTTYHRAVKGTEVPGVMAALDVLLVTSRNEGGPQPVLEALACGVPVISTDVGFVPELRMSLPRFVDIFEHTDEVPGLLNEARRNRERAQAEVLSIREALRPYTWKAWVKGTEKLLQTLAGYPNAVTNID